MTKLKFGWWVFICGMLVFELLATIFLDYQNDPMASIIFIHAVPLLLIASILIWGPSKEK